MSTENMQVILSNHDDIVKLNTFYTKEVTTQLHLERNAK